MTFNGTVALAKSFHYSITQHTLLQISVKKNYPITNNLDCCIYNRVGDF